MSAERTVRVLLRLYPAPWRARYGEELAALILDMSGGGRIPWRVRIDTARGGVRERWRAGDARSGSLTVMWAFALFLVGGAILQRGSEQWQQTLPGPHAAASVAFAVLVGGALAAGLLVLTGLGLAMPAFRAALRSGDWPRVRRPILVATALTVFLAAVTVGLSRWAHQLSPAARNGQDTAYTLVFLVWGILGTATLAAWTAAAARAARGLELSARVVRGHAWLAAAAAVVMALVSVAGVIWYSLVTGAGSPGAANLITALALMGAASAIALGAAARALRPPPAAV